MISPDASAPQPFEQGGLPDRARERIITAAGRGDGFFTSTFSVAEMAVARLAGYEPLSQVMGSSAYHVGWSSFRSTWGRSSELEAITGAHRAARMLALGRMEQEARILGADAVIGTVMNDRDLDAGEMTEFTAVGTAVRVRKPAGVAAPEHPALTTLSAQELYKLELAGLWPLGIAFGNCVWLDRHCDCVADGTWFNQEMPAHSWSLQAARERAVERFRAHVQTFDAAGAVGVQVQKRLHEHHYETGSDNNKQHHTEFKVDVHLIGTAVVRRTAPKLPRPRLVLDLGEQKIDLGERASVPISGE